MRVGQGSSKDGMARLRASGSGQQDQGQGQGQAVKVVIAERRQVIKAALRSLVEAAQPDLSPAEVDAVVAEVNKRMTMGSKQCVLAAVLCLPVLLQSFLAPAQLPPPVPLGIWDPKLLAQIKDAMELLTKASVLEHLMRGPHHSGIKLLPAEVVVFEQPSNAWLTAMLKQLDEEHLRGDLNTLNANATTVITSIQEFYRHPGRFIAHAPPPPPPAQAQPLPAAPGPAPPSQAPPGGRWLDRDTNGCLNLQRIGESRQRPIELCRWDNLEALPPVGEEYQQGYKRVNDRLPKGRQWLHRAAEYRRGIDGRARNNAKGPSSFTQAVSLYKA
ncbi:hypothetical protein QJQ45_007817 [Haematococcus lacustris]|nr:hypothetical protein QJQ45_007817 [Haematococcus lacustris]